LKRQEEALKMEEEVQSIMWTIYKFKL